MSSNHSLKSEEMVYDILPSLLDGPPFKTRPNNEKYDILRRGRPIPFLSIAKKDSSRGFYRSFQPCWYDIHKWLCASSSLNALFCWPCVLMRPKSSSWSSIGNDDMKMFTSMATKHAVSKSHLKAILEYDAALIELGLPSEFINRDKDSDDENSSNYSSAETFTLCFNSNSQNHTSASSSVSSKVAGMTEITNETYTDGKVPKLKTKITLKALQTLNNEGYSNSKCSEDLTLLKWKRKKAKQELKNAKLAEEKLKIEIDILKAKADYYKTIKSGEVT